MVNPKEGVDKEYKADQATPGQELEFSAAILFKGPVPYFCPLMEEIQKKSAK